MLRDVRTCAYQGRVVFRTDGELAISDLMGEVARFREDLPTVLGHGAQGDSHSSGFVEGTVRSVEDMIRTHTVALEEKVGEVLKVGTAAMAWLVNKRGWQDAVRKVAGPAVQWIYIGAKVSGGVMQERWLEDMCLGSRCTTLGHSVARIWAVRDLQKSPTIEDLDRIIGHPRAPQGVSRYRRLDVLRLETVPEPREYRTAAVPDPSRPIPRAVCITRAMLEGHGYSVEFQRCNDMRRGQTCYTGGHLVDHRRHMETALTQDEDYQSKVEQTNVRQNQYLAEEVQRSLKRRRETSERSEGHDLGQGDLAPRK